MIIRKWDLSRVNELKGKERHRFILYEKDGRLTTPFLVTLFVLCILPYSFCAGTLDFGDSKKPVRKRIEIPSLRETRIILRTNERFEKVFKFQLFKLLSKFEISILEELSSGYATRKCLSLDRNG